jgi:molecular chaperone Hsp33
MSDPPAFLDTGRPDVPDLVVPRGVVPFHLPLRPVRGRLVRLGPLADALLSRHDNHPAVTRLAGEALALVAALGSALKFRGSFSLQIKGDGPVSPLLADCTDSGALRCYARAEPDKLDELLADDAAPDAARLLGQGAFQFTADQGPDMDRYQGIVEIEGDDLAAMAQTYFRTSEQLRCEIRLACARGRDGWRAAALVLERVSGEGGVDPALDAEAQEEAWRTAVALAATVRDAELLDEALPAETLFGTEGIAADLPRALAYGCRCSRQRLAGILERFPVDDLDHMAVDGAILMKCEFCNFEFRFGRDEVRGKEPAAPGSRG